MYKIVHKGAHCCLEVSIFEEKKIPHACRRDTILEQTVYNAVQYKFEYQVVFFQYYSCFGKQVFRSPNIISYRIKLGARRKLFARRSGIDVQELPRHVPGLFLVDAFTYNARPRQILLAHPAQCLVRTPTGTIATKRGLDKVHSRADV